MFFRSVTPFHARSLDCVAALTASTALAGPVDFSRDIQPVLSHHCYECHGRDHHPRYSSIWFAGGGIKPGITWGKTDDFGYNIVENPVPVNDLNATILKCLGSDHKRLTVHHQGLDVRLTGVEQQQPVTRIMA